MLLSFDDQNLHIHLQSQVKDLLRLLLKFMHFHLCFPIGMILGREVFECYDDTELPTLGNFVCSHTFYIMDTDGKFQQCLFECLCASRRCNCSPDEITKTSTTFTS